MAVNQSSRLLSPEEIAVRAGQQVPYLRLPQRATVFAEREMRLRERAASHAMRDYLLFMAEVARAQHEVLQDYPVVALPNTGLLDAAGNDGVAPLGANWPRDPTWRAQFRRLLDRLLPRLAGSPARAAVEALKALDDDRLEQQADRLLNGVMLGLDLGTAPLIAAGLQAYWIHLVLATEAARGDDRLPPFGRTDDMRRCPCCASPPTASIARIGADASGVRYLHCALCSTQWHRVRITCTHCDSTKGIQFQSLEAADAPATDGAGGRAKHATVQAETCDECRHYLKIVHMERDLHVEPVADDLATVTLDLLVSEAGYQRHGVNLMLLFGDGGDPPDDADPPGGPGGP